MKIEEMAEVLERVRKIEKKKKIIAKEEIRQEIEIQDPEIELTGDDWIYSTEGLKGFYPSETASVAITQRNKEGNIEKTGIVSFYTDLPIVLADGKRAYLWSDSGIIPVVGVNKELAYTEVQIRAHIFGQKNRQHWIWMNRIIGFLNKQWIRTENSMGPYFVIRDFFYCWRKIEEGIEIIPMKAVLSEPFSNKPKEEIGAFVIHSLNQGVPNEQRFFLSTMSGEPVFTPEKIKKIEIPECEPYCSTGWIAGPTEETVKTVLQEMKNAVIKIGIPRNPNPKVLQFISELFKFHL